MPFSTDNAVVRLFPAVVTRPFAQTARRLSPSISAVKSLSGSRRPLSGFPLAAVLAAFVLMPATGAWASTDTVTTLADSGTGSLRATVAAASPGDIINFSATLTGGTITLASTLTISQDLTIQGPGASSLTISGGNAVEVFHIASGTVMISELTIANGSNIGGGGGIFNASTLTVSDCIFAGNSAPGGGGAIVNLRTLTVSNSTFSGNSAPGNEGTGGAILNVSGSPSSSATLTVSNSTFSGNSATAGGAIFNETGPSTVSSVTVATVSNSTFANNLASVFGGGGIYNQSGGPSAAITVNNSIFSGNSSPVANGGGAIYNSNNGGAVDIANASNNVFFNNTDVGGGEDDCIGCTSNTSETTTDPMLLPLGNYGGPTQTMLPQPGSSAICAGNNALAVDANNNPLTTDQRGFPLSPSTCQAGTVDVGAVQTNYLLVTTAADSGTGSLRAAITQANSSGLEDIGFPSSFRGTITLGSSLPALIGQINIAGPGAENLTLSGGGSSSVGSVLTISSGVQVSLFGLTIANGNANNGGGIRNSGTLTVTSSAFTSNSTPGSYGGAIENTGTLTVDNSTFSANSSGNNGGAGGAIDNSGTLAVDNSTFSANSSGNNGGAGGALYDTGTLTVSNSTFVGNSSANGGGVAIFGGTATIANSIFAHNTSASNGAAVFTPGSVIDAYNNLFFANIDSGIGSESDCFGCTINSQPIATDPMLAALGNYGGSTPTMLPLPGSAAICAGSVMFVPTGLTTDQRGLPRTTTYTIGGSQTTCVDVGAVQTNFQSVQFSSPSYSSVQNLPVSPAPVVTVTENGQSIGGVPITLLFSGASNTVSGLGPVTTAGGMGAGFGNLVVTSLGEDTLSVNLPITLPTALGGNTIQPAALSATATLNITAQTITFTAPSSVTYGVAPIALSATASSSLAVTFSVISGPATISGNTLTITGVGSVVITANQAGNANYAAATPVSQTIVVNPIGMVAAPIFTPAVGTYTSAQSVTIADSTTGASIYYTTDGSTPGAGTGTSTLYNGTPISVATSATINAIGVLTGYTNSAVAPAAYIINLPAPTITNPTLSATSLTVAPGSTGTLMVSVAGTGGFNSPVTLSCSGLPASATCSFNPATVTPSGSAAATTALTVSVATGATVGAVRHNSNPLFPGATFAVALCFLGFRKRRGLQMLLLLTVSVIGLSLFTGCSGSPASTASTSTVTVTARAAGVPSTTSTFTLTVQ